MPDFGSDHWCRTAVLTVESGPWFRPWFPVCGSDQWCQTVVPIPDYSSDHWCQTVVLIKYWCQTVVRTNVSILWFRPLVRYCNSDQLVLHCGFRPLIPGSVPGHCCQTLIPIWDLWQTVVLTTCAILWFDRWFRSMILTAVLILCRRWTRSPDHWCQTLVRIYHWRQTVVPNNGGRLWFQPLMPDFASDHWYQAVVPIINARFCFRPLAPSFDHWCRTKLPTIGIRLLFRPLMSDCSSDHWCQNFVQTSDVRTHIQNLSSTKRLQTKRLL
jgi:hypothetical protein